MFDQETIQFLSALPTIQDLSGESARSHLTQAYLDLVRLRVSNEIGTTNVLPESFNNIRNMANGMEIFCLIEFAREGQLLQSGRAAAFVAAQSLELLSEMPQTNNETSRHTLANPITTSLIESGLLYLIAGYYANSSSVARKLPSIQNTINYPANFYDVRQIVANNILGLFKGLIGLDVVAVEQFDPALPENLTNDFSRAPSDISASAESKLLSQIGLAITEYLYYLSGQRNSPEAAVSIVRNMVSTISQTMQSDSPLQPPAEFLLSYHLASLLEIVFSDLSRFATVHNVAPPSDADERYQSGVRNWLRAKARRKHALLWHSTKKWVETKHKENAVHTVVSMPTGSGKSFMAELALAERLHKGWGLYLAPMNALVRQIQYDLERELPELGIKKVHRFLTDEHTSLEEEIFTGAGTREIVIMTPEKALLAIRLKPEAFKSCSVCIFDECHLLSKEDRGATSDDLLSRLKVHAPNVHIMLMSAMIQNPQKLADWLYNITEKKSIPIPLNWKPTRSLRTLVTIPSNQLQDKSKKGYKKCSINLLGQATLAWQTNDDSLLIKSLLPPIVTVKAQNGSYKWNESKNSAAREIGEALVNQGISTLIFLNSNATHVMAQGKKASKINWQINPNTTIRHVKNNVNAWLTLAQTELGSSSPIENFHQKGVTVHSGALIDEERRAAEIAYKNGLVGLMIATGTLAQGLNFPSQAVIMAGIEGSSFVGERTAADILNALGRSGRAGFYNIGLSILLPKQVLQSTDQIPMPEQAEDYINLLHQQDACLDVRSALKEKVDRLISAAELLSENGKIHPNNLETATLIIGANTENVEEKFFKYSYAAYLSESEDYFERGIQAAQTIVNFFIKHSPCPDWMPELAQRSGLSIAWLTEMHQTIEENISLEQLLSPKVDFNNSLFAFCDVIKGVLPVVMVDKFQIKPDKNAPTQLQKLPKMLRGKLFDWSIDVDNSNFKPEKWKKQWDDVFSLLTAWISGVSFKDIAVEFFELSVRPTLFPEFIDYPRSDQSPLQKAIKTIKNISYPLRHLSGGFILLVTKMMLENRIIQKEEDIPLSIGMLPQAIHWGVDRLDKAFWYYNLLPVRCAAHVCANVFPIEYENDSQIKVEVLNLTRRVKDTPSILTTHSTDKNREILSAIAMLLN